jgi:DEAD/DEAH box helicase domain-containing protein
VHARVDPGDVRVLAEVHQAYFEAPALLLYDRVPNGVGLAERLFHVHRDVLRAALGLVQRCACRGGCPSCVGPAASLGGRSKLVASAILQGMLGEAVAPAPLASNWQAGSGRGAEMGG